MWGTLCHICGHEGATTADHLIPLAVWPEQPLDPKLSRPAHGTGNPCPTCDRLCNQEKGTKTAEEVKTDDDFEDYEL